RRSAGRPAQIRSVRKRRARRSSPAISTSGPKCSARRLGSQTPTMRRTARRFQVGHLASDGNFAYVRFRRMFGNAGMDPVVTSVSRSDRHTLTKPGVLTIRLVSGLGVEGDAHLGEKVKHRSRVRKNPDDPNLRQVHLLHEELFAELRRDGFDVGPGAIGENVTTRGIDLLGLPTGARLRLGPEAATEITGLRNPFPPPDAVQPRLIAGGPGRA